MTLQNRIINFLKSLPNLGDTKSRRAFIYSVGLDSELQDQIPVDEPPAQFVPLLVSQLVKYGKLNDERNALESVLETAKNYIGQDKKKDCEHLLEELRAKIQVESINEKYIALNKSSNTESRELEGKYDVALSFAGEDRYYVKEVAEILRDSGVKVFYDEFEEANLWGKNLYTYLRSCFKSFLKGREPVCVFCDIPLRQHHNSLWWQGKIVKFPPTPGVRRDAGSGGGEHTHAVSPR